jgi:2-polyprenyl-3-methyl-5-hydroxy-6-metoxy-1,4-benzoquinol methylase
MPQWEPSPQYGKIVEANRRFYARYADSYESTETCVVDPRAQRGLEHDLDRIWELLRADGGPVTVLDACGGSGTVAVKLLERGAEVTVCDISPELLDILECKCAQRSFAPRIVCAEIAEFLATDPVSYDLITFSSALHHLEDIEAVLSLARNRLRPGGLLFTVFDPTRRTTAAVRSLVSLDFLAFKLHRHARDVVPALWRRLRRRRARLAGRVGAARELELSDATVGVLAEYHVGMGIDDLALADRLVRGGFEMVWHERYAGARYLVTRFLLDRLTAVTAFKLLLLRPL